jgi:hypothetical protein
MGGASHGRIAYFFCCQQGAPRIATLIYVAAFVPRTGERVLALNQQDTTSQFGPNLW